MKVSRTGNNFLDALPKAVTERLIEGSKAIELSRGTCLYFPEEEPREVWCLTEGVASSTYTSIAGTTIELATVGREGVVGRSRRWAGSVRWAIVRCN